MQASLLLRLLYRLLLRCDRVRRRRRSVHWAIAGAWADHLRWRRVGRLIRGHEWLVSPPRGHTGHRHRRSGRAVLFQLLDVVGREESDGPW